MISLPTVDFGQLDSITLNYVAATISRKGL
jgi:hypothetical protein